MKPDTVIRKQLIAHLGGGNAYMTFDEAIAGFPPHYINRKPRGVNYTFWHLLEHMRIAQRDILEFILDSSYVSPEWPDGYWPAKRARADEKQWHNTIGLFREDLRSIADLVRSRKTDLYAPIPHAKKYTIFREVLVAADHNAYHTGELITLRQVMNIPPPNAW